jgi:hypothetical protein
VVPEGADQPEDLRLYRGPDVEQLPITEAVDADQSASISARESESSTGPDSDTDRTDAGRSSEEMPVEGGELSDEQREQMEEEFSDEDGESVVPRRL